MARKLFVNLPVRDLDRSKRFFEALGFTFDPKFTDDKAACMVVSEEAFVMLLTEPFFKEFTTKQPCATATHVEALIAYSADSRAEVDAIVDKALAGGGKEPVKAKDYGFMYQRSFEDLDGHCWEVLWMDPKAVS